MSTNIESLELEIVSNSTSAVSGIEALSQSLGKLKTATQGGLGLKSIANNISAISTAVNGINQGSLNNLTGLANAIKLLSGVKISSTMGMNITSIATALNGLNISSDVSGKIQKLVSSLRPLTEMGKSNLSSFLTPLKKLPETIATLNSVDMSAFTSKILELTTALKPLATEMEKVAAGFSAFPEKLQKAIQSNNNLSNSNGKAAKSFTDVYNKAKLAVQVIAKVAKVIYGFIDKSSDYIENVNLFTVAMGDYADEAKRYANEVSEVMGIDPGEWMRNQGLFQTLITGFGVAGDKASLMSKNLTQLVYDISSFYNIDTDQAMQKLKSGMAGELEPLRAIGYDLSQAKLEATAAELGITKAVSSMTQAEKSMLRYHAIMTQVTATHGDMARTLDQPANQIRVLKAQWEMLSREIGNVFMPALQAILPIGIAVTKVLREMVAVIASWTGFTMPEIDTGVETLASGSEDTATALEDASKAAKKLKSYTLGFDELNVINPNSESDSGSSTAGGVFDIELPEYDFLSDETSGKIDGIAEKIKEMFKPINELFETRIDWAKGLNLESLGEGFKTLETKIKPVQDAIWDINNWADKEIVLPIAGWVIEEALPTALSVIATAFDAIDKVLQPVNEGIKELKPVFEPIISWIGDVVITVFEGLREVFTKVADVFTEKGDTIKGIITGLGEIIAAIWTILKPVFDLIIPFLKENFTLIATHLAELIGGIIDVIAGIVDFIAGVFTGDWDRAWEGIVKIFSGVWEAIKSVLKFTWKTIKSALTLVWDAIKGLFSPVATWFNEKVIQPVADFFKGLWESVSGFFVNLWEDIVGVWKAVATWFDEKVIQPIVNFFSPIVEGISAFFEGCWLIIQAVWLVSSTWFNENVIIPIVDFFKGVWESVSGFFSSLWKDIVLEWTKVSTWFNETVVVPVVGFFKGVWISVSGFFSSLWEDIKEVWKDVSTWFDKTIIDPVREAFEKACEKIEGFFDSLWLGIRQGVANAMNGVIGGVESAINGIVGGINSLIGGFDDVVQWAADILGKNWGGISIIPTVRFNRITVPTFAEGGFPASGQAFIARENGIPEMVGTIGRRTAVANNEQIVESVASGVAEANSEQNILLREQNTLLRALLEKDNGVYLDGRSLSDSVDKHKREQGRVLITGGAL